MQDGRISDMLLLPAHIKCPFTNIENPPIDLERSNHKYNLPMGNSFICFSIYVRVKRLILTETSFGLYDGGRKGAGDGEANQLIEFCVSGRAEVRGPDPQSLPPLPPTQPPPT